MSWGVGTPSRERTSVVLLSSRMMSMHSSTHSSQMNTVGPAMSLRTSCWLLPQKEQYRVFLVSPLLALVISAPDRRPPPGRPVGRRARDPACRHPAPRCKLQAGIHARLLHKLRRCNGPCNPHLSHP